jgi:hypothetical protein
MYLLIVTLPLLGSCVASAFGRFLSSRGTAIVTSTCVSLSFILSLISFYEVALEASACYIKMAPWVNHASARWCVGQRARSTHLLKRAQLQIFSNYFAAISFLARGKMLRSAEGKGPKLADAVRLSGKGKRHRSLK